MPYKLACPEASLRGIWRTIEVKMFYDDQSLYLIIVKYTRLLRSPSHLAKVPSRYRQVVTVTRMEILKETLKARRKDDSPEIVAIMRTPTVNAKVASISTILKLKGRVG